MIGFTVLGLLFIYILHGFIAPTFVRGRIWIRTEKGSGYATDYRVEYNGNDYPVSTFGYWVVPLYQGGIPGRLRLQILNAQKEVIERFTIIGPVPAWHAIFEMYYECEIELSKPMGQRLKWVRNNDSVPLDTALGSLAVSKAGAELPLRAESPQKTGTEWRVTQLQAQPVVVLVLNSVELTFRHKSPSPSRYSQIYFSVRSAGRPIDDRALLGLVSGGSDAPVASWTPSEETSPRRFLFPLMLFRESWLPVWEDRRPLYGIAANVTSLVDLDRQNQIRPKGLIELLMHSSEYSSYTEVARLDITRAFWTPGVSLDFQDFSFALPGPTVRVTVLRSLGFSGASK